MTTHEVANALVELCKQGENLKAVETLYAENVVSVEDMEGPMARLEGHEAVRGKTLWWFGAHEYHGGNVEGPWVHGNQFVVRFTMDITEKESGKRMNMDEVGVYTVENGKVVHEYFFYSQAE